VQAVAEKHRGSTKPPPPIEVTICESQQHVIIRISDQGGGVPRDSLPYMWSFSKGPASQQLLANLGQVPKLAATMQELQVEKEEEDEDDDDDDDGGKSRGKDRGEDGHKYHHPGSSLASLASRPPNLRLGMGLPLSRVYAEYWAGSLALHSLEGYGVDAFLQISKLGNKNEQLATRATMDAV
jgi:pyruvate dehydrogenase kinase 2/3/4